jgi:hypothetical protein
MRRDALTALRRAEVRVTSVRTVNTDGHVDVALGSQ